MVMDTKLMLRLLRQGNAKAFKELYYNYHKRLFNFSLKILRNTQEAEDLVQEVFVAIWETRGELDENKSFTSFIFMIAKNKALNKIKKKLSHQVYVDYIQKETQYRNDLRKDIESHELIKFIEKTIHELPGKTKKIFLLSRNEGLTYREIAQKLNISDNIVDHEIRKSLQYIKNKIKKFY
jgi:RNA polymerase sigma-70 factor, ECF subfamily